MTRQDGVFGTTADLVRFAHVGWVIATTLNSACARRNTPPMVASATSGSSMWPNMRETSESAEVATRQLEDFYAVRPGTKVVDPEASLAKRVAATEEALAAGYTGSRAVVDVTTLVRTSEQREAFARYEWGLTKSSGAYPAGALCAYDASQLRDAAAELICLPPFRE